MEVLEGEIGHGTGKLNVYAQIGVKVEVLEGRIGYGTGKLSVYAQSGVKVERFQRVFRHG